MSEPIPPTGPELTKGVLFADVPDGGILIGQAAGEPVLLVRRGNEVWAVAAACGHWGFPLADGIVVDCQIRCPVHHAWFDCRTGEAVDLPPRAISTPGRCSVKAIASAWASSARGSRRARRAAVPPPW